jgi:hypothetical protein
MDDIDMGSFQAFINAVKMLPMHWFWRAVIAILGGCVYGGISISLLKSMHRSLLARLSKFSEDPLRTVLVYFLPAILLAVLLYAILTHYLGSFRRTDHETRCRKCQYILKGISEPICPECGEQI